MNYFKKIFKSVGNALRGLKYAYRHDQSFRMECWGVLGYLAVVAFAWPLSELEWLFLVLSYVLILISELINTSVEQMLGKLHPEIHEVIGRVKDIASASVLVSFFFAVVVVFLILGARF